MTTLFKTMYFWLFNLVLRFENVLLVEFTENAIRQNKLGKKQV
jgi:hypothetical protein